MKPGHRFYFLVLFGTAALAFGPACVVKVGASYGVAAFAAVSVLSIITIGVYRLRSDALVGWNLGTRPWQRPLPKVMTTSLLMMFIGFACLTNSHAFDVPWLGYVGMALEIQFAIVAVPLFALLLPFIVIDAQAARNLDAASTNNEDAEPADARESPS